MKQTLLTNGIIALFLSVGTTACEAPDPLTQIIEKNTEARGGADAIASVQTFQSRVQIVEPTFKVMGEYVATRDGKMRIDIFADGQRVLTEAFDGESGWQMFGDGTVAGMTEAGEEILRIGIIKNLYGLSEMADLGVTVSYLGSEVIAGLSYEKVDLTFANDYVTHYFLDSETGLRIRQRDDVALHPDYDDTIQRFVTVYSDFRTIGGVVYSFYDEKLDIDTGELAQTTQVEEIILNGEIDPTFFERPEG